MGGKISGFDPYKHDKEKSFADRCIERKKAADCLKKMRDTLDDDPLKRVFAAHKGGQSRKMKSGTVKVTLPTLKFLEKK